LATDNGQYCFGGQTQFREKKDLTKPSLLSNTDLDIKRARDLAAPTVVRVMDYTKNISQDIFRPMHVSLGAKSVREQG